MNYVKQTSNILDVVYIVSSVTMSVVHYLYDPFHIFSKIIICVVIMLSIARTMKYMKILENFSPVITILENVISDL